MDENIDLGRKLEDEYEKLRQNINKPNILIAGGTGVGKSSIINYIFGDKIARVGTGKPITSEIEMFKSDDVDVRIYDSKGYEIKHNGDEEFFKKVVDLPTVTQNPSDAVHLIWYCIATSSGRVTEYDINAIKKFSEAKLPIAVLLTKVDISTREDVDEMTKIIHENFPNMNVFQTSVTNDNLNHMEELIEWSTNNLEAPLRLAFIKSQKLDLKGKWKKAHIMIAEHAAAAFAVGFTPIPMSDAPVLVVNELGLLARILYLYDLGSVSDTIKQAGLGATLTALLTSGGKAAVGALLKLIPTVGTVVGGLISGGVGASITFAFGEATSAIGFEISKAKLNGNQEYAEEMIAKLGTIILEKAKQFMEQGKKSSDDYDFDDLD